MEFSTEKIINRGGASVDLATGSSLKRSHFKLSSE